MNIRITFFRLLTVLLFCTSCLAKTDELRNVVSESFPKATGLEIACWVVPEEGEGYLSQIVVFQVNNAGRARVLWQSDLDPAYSPQIRFAEEFSVNDVPIALVERQNGAATSQLDIIGKVSGRFQRLNRIDGFKFEVEHFDGSKQPLIIAHTDGNILDIPRIYKWNGSRFVEDSESHPAYYRQLLSEDKAKLPPDSSGIVSVNLSRIALLSGNSPEAKTILDKALSRERQKGDGENKETLRRVTEALQDLGAAARQ